MTDKERRLGRGLESLIGGGGASGGGAPLADRLAEGAPTRDVSVEAIEPNPYQPRRHFDEQQLTELMSSLESHGLMQPVVVRARAGRYQLIAGERRWRAARELGWSTITAAVIELADDQMLEWALIENIQRSDLGPIDLGQAYRRMIETLKLTQDELAKRIGQSRSAVANTLRLLDLPDAVKARVSRGTVSMGAARALLSLGDPAEMERVSEQVAEGKLTVRQVEALSSPRKAPPQRRADPNLDALAEELQQRLGTKVEIRGTLKKGKLQIEYYTSRQLDHVVRHLRNWPDEEAVEETGSDLAI